MHYDLPLPSCNGFGLEGGPAFDVEVVEVNSGFEKRNKNQATPRRAYRVSYPPRRKALYQTLLDFFEVIAEGRANSFLLLDPFDFEVDSTQGMLTLLTDESPSISYQAIKRSTYEGYTKDRTIQKLKNGTISVYNNGVLMGGGYTVNYSTGVINITAPGGPFTWAGEFYVPVRFDADPMSAVIVNKRGDGQYLIEWSNIPLREVRIA